MTTTKTTTTVTATIKTTITAAAAAAANVSSSAYKATQVKHRRRPNNPLYNDDLFDGSVIDFSRSLSSSQHHPRSDARIITIHEPPSRPPELSSSSASSNPSPSFSSSDRYDGPLFGLTSHPGFIYAPRALSERAILELAYESLSRYCERPHVTNRDGVVDNSDGGCQNSKRRIRRRKCDGEGNSSCNNNKNHDDDDDKEDGSLWDEWKRQHIYEKINNQRRRRHHKQQPSSSCRLKKISWSTMGYHYDWTNRSYHDDKQSIIPSELIRLAQYFARCCGSVKEYHPQACIVNFYNTKSLMGGHRDDLELTFTKPVISLSMGRPAIFLLGGRTKDDAPVVPILVRPGDVMMLGGESRLCFHGMARVVPRGVTVPDEVREEGGWWRVDRYYEEEERGLCEEELRSVTAFLEEHRINVNVRQVLSDGVETIREGIARQHGMERGGGV